MTRLVAARTLLAVSALALAAGAASHALAYGAASAALRAGHVPPFFESAFAAGWLTDSGATAFCGLLCALLAARPSLGASRLAWSAVLLPVLLGAILVAAMPRFFAGYVFLAAALMAGLGILFSRPAAGACSPAP